MNHRQLAYMAFLALLAVATGASADNKTVPGGLCVPYGGFGAQFNGSFYDHTGKFRTSTDTWAVCPMIRENNSEPFNAIWVRVKNSSGAAVSCKAHTISATGSSYYDTDWSTAYNDHSFKLQVDDMPTFSGGSYWASCLLPPTSSIISMRWDEPTD